MRSIRLRKLILLALFVIAAAFNFKTGAGFDGTEFAGGRITGPILTMSDFGFLFFLVAAIGVWFLPRVASIFGLLAALLSAPLVAYIVAPGPFRRVFPGEYSVPLQSSFHWNGWGIACGATFVAAYAVATWNLFSFRKPHPATLLDPRSSA